MKIWETSTMSVNNDTVRNVGDSLASDSEESEQQFDKDFHDDLIRLEHDMHNEEGTANIVTAAVKACYEFYDADWAGVLTADPITKMWSPSVWLSRRTGWNSETLFEEYEVFEDYPRWVDSLHTGEPVIIGDVSKLTDLSKSEERHYKKLHVTGVIGAPFGERPTGFMVIKNPRRYKTNPDFAKMMAFVGLSTLYLDELFNQTEMIRKADTSNVQAGNQVRINLFGVPGIQSAFGSTDATQYKSQQGWELIAYLALSRKPIPSRSIAEKLWPEENIRDKADGIRGIRYRFLKNIEYLKVGDLVTSSEDKTGYTINPDIPVTCDVWEFEELIAESAATRNVRKKAELLEQAVSLYKGTIFKEISDKPWLMTYALPMDALYEKSVLELMGALEKMKDYNSMHRYVLAALEYMPENPDFYYWLVKSLEGFGSTGVMKKQMDQIKSRLTEEEYEQLIGKLKEEEQN